MPKYRSHDVAERLYTRTRGAHPRYYADFRDFGDVGGAQEALIPEGCRSATTDRSVAEALAAARLNELLRARSRAASGTPKERSFDALVRPHLKAKKQAKKVGSQWLGNVRVHLETAAQFFGPSTDLALVTSKRVDEYVAWLLTQPNGRGGTLSPGSIHQYLDSLGQLFRRAVSWELLADGTNPVAALFERPKIERAKTFWLEVPEVAEILRFAFEEYKPVRPDLALPWFPEVLSTIALTGCREAEVLGVCLDEVDMARRIITIQDNEFRTLKTPGSARPVRMVTQLWEILDHHLSGPHAPTGRLLFSSNGESKSGMIIDLRKRLDLMPMPERLRRPITEAERERLEEERYTKLARWERGGPGPKPKETVEELMRPIEEWIVPPLRTKMLRHSWAAARIQTLDHGHPVALYTVSKEMGHMSMKMLERIYAHLGVIRVRGDEVAFRW